ncbi:MAG: hypothetical protein PHW61_08525 [Eubacteriales bacterium]|nr:hypothetical protein [Eubacteriales bacterium]
MGGKSKSNFEKGAATGGAVFGIEFGVVVLVFGGNALLQAVQSIHAIPPFDSDIAYYAPFVAVFGIIGLIEFFGLGVVNDMEYSWGFLLAYIVPTIICALLLAYLSPGALVGMITSWVVVFLGMIVRLFRNPPQYSQYP